MLDLQPRVDFQEVELAVGRQQKLDRAGVDVADGLGARARRRRSSRGASASSSAGEGDSSMIF